MFKNNNTEQIEFNAEKEYLKKRLLNGLKELFTTKKGLQLVIVIMMCEIVNYIIVMNAYADFFLGNTIVAIIMTLCSTFIITTIVSYLLGAPLISRKVREKLHRIGLINSIGETPELMKVENGKTTKYIFRNAGIPPKAWEDAKDAIQTVFGISIINFKYINGATIVEMEFVDGNTIPMYALWDDGYLQNQTTLALGIGNQGLITVDMLKTPHMLIGGTTGSGKSVLFQSVMIQAHKAGAETYIIDPKGIDFSPKWQSTYDIYSIAHTDEEISGFLDYAISEIDRRIELFTKLNVPNFNEYQKMNDDNKEKLNAIYLGIDEFSQLFDKTALSKEGKVYVDSNISKVSTIARIGRAFGIYLVLATQRPDANVLPGQIKNMLTVRIAGKCDNVLSQIILDSTFASREIIGFNPGRFITNDGIQFQGFIHKKEESKND